MRRIGAAAGIAAIGITAVIVAGTLDLRPPQPGTGSGEPTPTATASSAATRSGPPPTPRHDGSVPFGIEGCDALGFSATRCRLVVVRALEQANPPVPAGGVAAARMSPATPPAPSLGSFPVAMVTFDLVRGGSVDVEVRCGLTLSDRACNPEASILVRAGVDRDVPCNVEPSGQACATPPPPPRPASVRASTGLAVPAIDVPIDRLGRYELLVGTAQLPDGVLSERSLMLVDPRPTTYWIEPGIELQVRPDLPGRPAIGNIYRDPFDGPEPVRVYLVFDVVEFQPGAVLMVRDLTVR